MTRDPKLSLYRTSWRPRWGKGVTRKAKKLAGPVRLRRIEDLPQDQPREAHMTNEPTQQDLFSTSYPPNLYQGAPPSEPVSTSEAAAASIRQPSGKMRRAVLDFITQRGFYGATDDEVEAALGMRHQSASARRRELYLAGQIRSTGKRPTRSGREAKVWVKA